MATTNNRAYVLWRRVSTKEQGDSELGLKAQKAIAEYFMKSEPEKVYTDVYTGTKLSECRNLWRAIKHCKETGLLLVIAKTDRFRNVIEALTVLDEIGEGNLMFCDLPTTDRTVLTIVFALWERQAIQGRINTKVALEERKKQLNNNGSFISKSGRVCTKLGRPADYVDGNGKERWDMSAACEASGRAKQDAAVLWRQQSAAYNMVREWNAMGKNRNDMLDELRRLYEHAPEKFGTIKGQCVTRSVLDRWCREMTAVVV